MSAPDHTHDTPTFTGMPLDRAMDERADPAVIGRLLDDPRANVLAASEQGVLIGDGDTTLAHIAKPIAWAFTIWGTALYLWAGVIYAIQYRAIVRADPR